MIAPPPRQIPLYTHENDVLREMGALAADHLCSSSLIQSRLQKEIIPAIVPK
jgi:hypothetical protein